MMEQVRRRKKRHILMPILFTLLIVIVLTSLVVGYLALASGMYRPSWIAGAYQPPLPTRSVMDVSAIEPFVLKKRVTDDLLKQMAMHPTSTTQTVVVSERDVTGLVQSASQQLASRGIQLNRGQVVILPDHLELFAEIQKDGHTLDVLGTFIPTVSNGGASLEWQTVKIGSLSVSPAFAQSLINTYIGQTASIQASFGNAILQSIHLEDGKAELVFEKR